MQNKKKWKAIAKRAADISEKIAVIGIGLAIYENRWWPVFIFSTIAAIITLLITWRLEDG